MDSPLPKSAFITSAGPPLQRRGGYRLPPGPPDKPPFSPPPKPATVENTAALLPPKPPSPPQIGAAAPSLWQAARRALTRRLATTGVPIPDIFSPAHQQKPGWQQVPPSTHCRCCAASTPDRRLPLAKPGARESPKKGIMPTSPSRGTEKSFTCIPSPLPFAPQPANRQLRPENVFRCGVIPIRSPLRLMSKSKVFLPSPA